MHGAEVTDIYDKKFPTVDSNHTFLAVISLDSALKKDGSYYQKIILKACKYIEKKVIRYINDNLSDFSSSDESDKEWMFFDKYLKWMLFSLLLTHKHVYKV